MTTENPPVPRTRRSLDRVTAAADDRGSIAILMMVTLIGLMLGALLVPMIVTQVGATRFDTIRAHQLNAAQAGIDTMLGLIRKAVGKDGQGDSSMLPCQTQSGTVSSAGEASYRVSVEYFTVDPLSKPAPVPMICTSGYGTYDPASGAYTPSYARLTAFGLEGAAATDRRKLVTTYVLKTDTTNIVGGKIRIFPSPTEKTPLCIDAGSGTPSPGSGLSLQACGISSPPPAQQVFAYRTDLTLQLLSSVTGKYPNGLCLNLPLKAGGSITLAECGEVGDSTPPLWDQQWSYNDNGHYQSGLPTSNQKGDLGTPRCMGVVAPIVNAPLTQDPCTGSIDSPIQAWIPEPSVGAGAAASPQWVNYDEFGRCLDVSHQDVNTPYLIDYPCKQNPFAGAVAWNQKFTSPVIDVGATFATGTFSTASPSGAYCLTSLGKAAVYVVIKPCSGSPTQTWTRYGGDKSLSYATKYTIVDSSALCLSLGAPNAKDVDWSTIVVEPCDGSSEQKWNADPNLATPTLKNTTEVDDAGEEGK